jgi:PDZ domain-containing protein
MNASLGFQAVALQAGTVRGTVMTELLRKLHLRTRLAGVDFTWGAGWLVALPLGLWLVATLYVPLVEPFFTWGQAWGMAVLIMLLVVVSIWGHALAHLAVGRLNEAADPDGVPLYPLGDAAQVWPGNGSAWLEATAGLAGPVFSAVLALACFFLWNAQLNPYVNLVTLFLMFYNGALAALNLMPAFPMDGGRLVRATLWGLLGRPVTGHRLGRYLGILIPLLLTGWAIYLIEQRARFSWETGGATLLFAALMLVALVNRSGWRDDAVDRVQPPSRVPGAVRVPLVVVLVLAMVAAPLVLVPTNEGLEAPGLAASVEPMVQLPENLRHAPQGTFILTSVIPQAPITFGEWVYAKLSPVIALVPPQRIVPAGTTPQKLAERGKQQLDQSEMAAVVVGLRLAGYNASIEGTGVDVLSVVAGSPADGELRPGDVIVAANGAPVRTPEDLSAAIRAVKTPGTLTLQVQRQGQTVQVSVTLPQPEPGQTPKLGVTIQEAGYEAVLPFPVEIVPKKLAGGPSAGLMFTLTVYNLLTPEDLTHGLRIAGTGTIALDGTVGPIGGVKQKVPAAEGAGAVYFLSPPENYADAVSVANRIEVVEVATAQDALDFLQGLSPGGQ